MPNPPFYFGLLKKMKKNNKALPVKSSVKASAKENQQKKTTALLKRQFKKNPVRIHSSGAVFAAQPEIKLAKFYTGIDVRQPHQHQATELPERYHENKIVLLVRDPWWLFSYWEVKSETVEEIKGRFKERFNGAKLILRAYDVSYIVFNGKNANYSFDIEVNSDLKNWYIDVGRPGSSWCVDIGFKLVDGTFIMIARSNTVATPSDAPSIVTDEEWMIPDDLFARLYGMGFGFGPNSPVGRDWRKYLKAFITSPGVFSVSSPQKGRAQKQKDFWLIANTELIVYGATRPDAKVKIFGKPVKLQPDGTFSLRFALSDGTHEIPIEAKPADDSDRRTITPIVSQKTH